MSLLKRIRGFFSGMQRTLAPHKQGEGSEEIEMRNLAWFKGSFELNGGPWEILSLKEIAAADKAQSASMYARLDEKNAATRVAPRQPTEDIGQREVEEGFVVLDTPRQMAMNFANLLDEFNTEESSFMF